MHAYIFFTDLHSFSCDTNENLLQTNFDFLFLTTFKYNILLLTHYIQCTHKTFISLEIVGLKKCSSEAFNCYN